jgi:branched-chain amino acid transport system permease protein
MKIKLTRNTILSVIALALFAGFLTYAQSKFNPYVLRIMNLCAIFTIFAVTFNLIYGYTGQFSLGHAGFAAVGAYVAALLTMTPDQKVANFFLKPIVPVLANVQWPFLPAMLLGGVLAAATGFLVGWPALRLRGDYLAIATLGFGEIIRVMFVNWQTITNGSLGLKGIPGYTNLYWSWGAALITIFVIKRLVDSSYGRALKSVRDDEIAAEALGIRLFYHKMLAFLLSAFFIGVGGALLANLISTIDPKVFLFFLTYQIVGITVMGGMGSLTGSAIAACLYTVFLEVLRPIESPFNIGPLRVPGVPGMRMVLFSVLLLMVILFYRRGLLGSAEFSWDWVIDKGGALLRRLSPGRGAEPAPAVEGEGEGKQ